VTLAALLHEDRARNAATYRGGLSNHLPMCLTALSKLGAPAERLRAYAQMYQARLEPAVPSSRMSAYAAELARPNGVDTALREHLHALSPGLAGAAFHGVIRVAYGVIASDRDAIASALAYTEESTLLLPVAEAGSCTEIGELADRLRAARIERPSHKRISDQLLAVAADRRFLDVVRDLAVDQSTLGQVSAQGARWYFAADDFASLHVLTGAHALRVLRPFLAEPQRADRALAVAALACFVACGSPARADARGQARAEDKELKALAIDSDDDHVAKLVLACFDEERALEDQIYRIVATRAARRGRA
jgi:hypothetical protein